MARMVRPPLTCKTCTCDVMAVCHLCVCVCVRASLCAADLGPVLVPVIDLSTSETSAPAVSALPSPQAVVVVDADSPEVKLTQEAVLEATEPASVEHTQEATQPATVEPIQEATQPATVEPAQEAAHSAAVETTQVAAGEGGSVEATQVAEAGAAQVGTVEATEGASVRAPKPSDKVSTRSSKRSTARQTPAAGGDANTAGLSTGVASRCDSPSLVCTHLSICVCVCVRAPPPQRRVVALSPLHLPDAGTRPRARLIIVCVRPPVPRRHRPCSGAPWPGSSPCCRHISLPGWC